MNSPVSLATKNGIGAHFLGEFGRETVYFIFLKAKLSRYYLIIREYRGTEFMLLKGEHGMTFENSLLPLDLYQLLLKILNAGRIYLEQIIVFAGHGVAFKDISVLFYAR